MTPIRQTFSLAGVTKCGTSSLHAYLSQHPDICVSTPKEPWCFEDPSAYAHYVQSDFREYYARNFPNYTGQSAVGDCNPRKLTFPWSLRLLHQQMPDGKILILVRNPSQRAFSEWWMDYYAGSEELDFESALEENLKCELAGRVLHDDEETALRLLPRWFESRRQRQPMPTRAILGTGYYWKGVERAQRLFTPERVKVVAIEALKQSPRDTMHEIFQFLEVRPDIDLNLAHEHNRAHGELARKTISFARMVGLPRLVSYCKKEKLLKQVGSVFASLGDKQPVLKPETRHFLDDHYQEHNRRLVELTGIDISAWKSRPIP